MERDIYHGLSVFLLGLNTARALFVLDTLPVSSDGMHPLALMAWHGASISTVHWLGLRIPLTFRFFFLFLFLLEAFFSTSIEVFVDSCLFVWLGHLVYALALAAHVE